jgi:hypothetical protein
VRLSREGRKGRRYLLDHRWADAAEAFRQPVTSGHPAPAEVEGFGYALLKSNQFGEAARIYQDLCRKYPRKSSFWVNLGLAYALQEPAHLNEAKDAFEHARAVNPHDPNALLNLAVVFHRLADFPHALPLYKEAAKWEPKKGYVLTGLADLLRDQGNFDAAYWIYQRALVSRDERGWAPIRLGLARLSFARENYYDAIHYADEFLYLTEGSPERWARDRNEAKELSQRALLLLGSAAHALPAELDRDPPQIQLLSPVRLIAGEKQGEATLHVDRDQVGILGVVSDDRAVNQVTVNGVYVD